MNIKMLELRKNRCKCAPVYADMAGYEGHNP